MSDDSVIVDFLKDHDATCPRCRYNLRGVQSAKCPECGQQIALMIDPKRRIHYGAYIATLTSVTLSAGCGLPWWIYVAEYQRGLVPRWLADWFVNYTWTCFWLMILVLVMRKFFLARSQFIQWAIASLFILLAIFTVLIQWSTPIGDLYIKLSQWVASLF